MNRLIINDTKSLLAILPLLGSLGFVPSASAQETLVESCALACPKGFSCNEAPSACPAVFCDDPADCPACEGSAVFFCAPDACASDADCAAGALCAPQLTLECPPPAASGPGYVSSATAPTPYECTSSTPHLCTPRWQLPCDVDSDCGSGFLCQELEQVSCDGALAPADPLEIQNPGSAPPPPPPVSCTSTSVRACVQVDTLCGSTADCPLNMECVDNGISCTVTDGGQAECERQQPEKVCRPQVTAVATASLASAGSGDSSAMSAGEGEEGVANSQGGCSLSGRRTPGGRLALFATLGLAALFATRRKEVTPRARRRA